MYYRTAFTIGENGGGDKTATLEALRSLTLEEMGVRLLEGTEEWGEGPDGAYWELVVERPTLDASGDTVRLEIRAHAPEEGRIRAEIVTRYGWAATAGQREELPTFPPKILETISAAMPCQAGTTTLSPRARTIRAGDARPWTEQTLRNPQRTLPLILMTRKPDGRYPRNPNTLQEHLLGAAEVAVLEGNATHTVRKALGRATYGGATRIVGTGDDPTSAYYRTAPDPRMLIRSCLDLTADDGFDQAHSAIRNGANREEGATISGFSPETDKGQERAESQRDEPKDLPAGYGTLTLRQDGTDAVTLLNHAVNLARDPLRTYATSRLRATYGNRVGEQLAKVGRRGRRGTRALAADPENAIDVNDLPDIISTFGKDFGMSARDQAETARILREVRQTRNLAAHPPVNGLSREQTVGKITTLERALKHLGDDETASKIGALRGVHETGTGGTTDALTHNGGSDQEQTI